MSGSILDAVGPQLMRISDWSKRTALMSYAGWRIGGPWGAVAGVGGSLAAEIPRQAAKLGEAFEVGRTRDL